MKKQACVDCVNMSTVKWIEVCENPIFLDKYHDMILGTPEKVSCREIRGYHSEGGLMYADCNGYEEI